MRTAKKKSKKAAPYHWFQGASVRALYDQIGAAGPDSVRVEVHQDGKQMTFLVVPEVSTELHNTAHINDSHLCPPDCPD